MGLSGIWTRKEASLGKSKAVSSTIRGRDKNAGTRENVKLSLLSYSCNLVVDNYSYPDRDHTSYFQSLPLRYHAPAAYFSSTISVIETTRQLYECCESERAKKAEN